MAVPKKKSSRSRRNMRRFSANKRRTPAAITTTADGVQVRTHRVTLAMVREGRANELTAKAKKAART